MNRVLVTGGAGFIGSNFVRLLRQERPEWQLVVLDKLTYAGRMENINDLLNDGHVQFVLGDIVDPAAVATAMANCNRVFNFAAESHVDRSLLAGAEHSGVFVQANVYGVHVLLEEARRQPVELFVQVSTDEVYGDIATGHSVEADPLQPRSPYSATKAGGELLALSHHASHGVPVIVTRGSNNFGPYQFPEKLIPLFITNALRDRPLPVYGDGKQRRDWVYVEDHCRGILAASENGRPGNAYNVGGGNERDNLEITSAILQILDKPATLVRHVTDRPGHDRRYALDTSRLREQGWQPRHQFEAALEFTVRWYVQNQWWWQPLAQA